MATEFYENNTRTATTRVVSLPYPAYNDENLTSLIKTNLATATSGDDFYSRLVELKNEQKKTLEYMKELYTQKQVLKGEIEKSEQTFNELRSSVAKPFDPKTIKFERNTISAYETNLRPEALRNDLVLYENGHHPNHNVELLELNDTTATSDCRICVENHKNDYATTSHQKPPLPSSAKRTNERQLDDNLKKIEKMWDQFNLDDYNNRAEASAELLKHYDTKQQSQKVSFEDDWAYKVTIPKPFKQTLREEAKVGKKSKRQLELEEELRRKEEDELKECNKQFKATPVPAHVYKPLFEEKQKEEQFRKLRLQLESKEYLESVPKPFNVATRERRHSFSGETGHEQDILKDFVANPLPEFYFDNDYLSERRKEEELYRKIKTQIRSHELMKNSKLPRNMRLQREKKRLEAEREQFSADQLKRLAAKERSNSAASMRKSYDVPNYDNLYKKFTTELEAKRSAGQSKTTVCKPFSLQTNTRAKKKAFLNSTSSRASSGRQSAVSFNDSMTRLQRSMSASMDTMPIMNAQAQLLRESVTKSKINNMVLNETRKEHIEKIKKIKAEKMAKQMKNKLTNPAPAEVSKNINMKTRKLKLEDQKKQEEFERHLEEMHKKVESRKFLFEQADEENARKAAERKFRDTLKNAGLSEDILYESNNNSHNNNKKVAKAITKSYVMNDDNWINE